MHLNDPGQLPLGEAFFCPGLLEAIFKLHNQGFFAVVALQS
jgi:hypothetical protein